MLMRPLPVRALVTVGGAVEVDQLHPPANVVVERFAALGRATYDSLVITHAGRGTVMAAVSAGVPLVCVPIGRDQPAVAHASHSTASASPLNPAASVEKLRSAIEQVLREPAYRQACRRMARPSGPESHHRRTGGTRRQSLTG